MTALLNFCTKHEACSEAVERAKAHKVKTLGTAWKCLDRVDWMLWCAERAGWEMDPAKLRLFACDCTERVLPAFEKKFPNDNRPRQVIETARRYAVGKATLEELEAAGSAARSAAAAAWSAERAWQANRLRHYFPKWEGKPMTDTMKAVKVAADEMAKEVANLMAWEKQDARQRGKTAEGRTVTALGYTLSEYQNALRLLEAQPQQDREAAPKVRRYSADEICFFIHREDYAALSAEVERLKSRNAALREAVKNLGVVVDNAYCMVVRDACPKLDSERVLTHKWVCEVLNHLKERINAALAAKGEDNP